MSATGPILLESEGLRAECDGLGTVVIYREGRAPNECHLTYEQARWLFTIPGPLVLRAIGAVPEIRRVPPPKPKAGLP